MLEMNTGNSVSRVSVLRSKQPEFSGREPCSVRNVRKRFPAAENASGRVFSVKPSGMKSGRPYGGNAPAVMMRLGEKNERKQIMEVRALTKNVRISPEKARHVSRLIQGKSVAEALAIVDLSPRKAAALIGKTLRSAIANAENNCDVNRKALTVKAALVSPGPIIRRFRPKARGSAGRIRKRTSHMEVILTDN